MPRSRRANEKLLRKAAWFGSILAALLSIVLLLCGQYYVEAGRNWSTYINSSELALVTLVAGPLGALAVFLVYGQFRK